MTKGGRIFGGIFSIIGSAIVLIMAWVFWFVGLFASLLGIAETWIFFGLLLASGILGLIGGILLLVDKTAGGVLAIIGGVVDVGFTIYLVAMMPSGSPMLFLAFWYFIPPAILLTGGIVGTAVGSEFS